MNITFWLNGVKRQAEVRPDELLLDFLRKNSCYSVKRGCETANCGLCTVLMRECRRKQRNSALLWQMREQSSVASAIRDLS